MTRYRGIVPGTFTMGNVVCGFVSILSSFEGNIIAACWFIILAGFLDALDGKIARLSGATSQFGVELDSLADFLSFGVAPAVLVYALELGELGRWGWIISIVYIMAAAYRLARFNILADTEEKKNFSGLPVPLAAFSIVSYLLFSQRVWGELRVDHQTLITIIILLSFLMISQVEYEILPERFQSKRDRIRLLVLLLALVAIGIWRELLLFPVVALYIILGVLRELYRLTHLGVGKMAGPNRRRKDDYRQTDD